MNSHEWQIPTPVLDPTGKASDEIDQMSVDATHFFEVGWRHVARDHFDHPAWKEVLSGENVCEALQAAAMGEDPPDREVVEHLLEKLRDALSSALGRPQFVTSQEQGYAVLWTDPGQRRSVFDRDPVEERKGSTAVADSGLIVIVSNARLATAYFPDGTEQMKAKERFREAATLVRRKANLGGYHDHKLERYWCRLGPATFHDRQTWAWPSRRPRRLGHGAY
ncbi:MAG: hypothetical protein V2A76_13740 [Planctomycetota bacterium]